MNVSTVELSELTRPAILKLPANDLSVLYRRFGFERVSQIIDGPDPQQEAAVNVGNWRPATGETYGEWTVIRHDGRRNGEDLWECERNGKSGFARTTSQLYEASLDRVPSAGELRAMSANQYEIAVKKYGQARIEKVLSAAKPVTKPMPGSFRAVVDEALENRWGQIVQNRRSIKAISSRLESIGATDRATVDEQVFEAINSGEVDVDLRKLGLDARYGFEIIDSFAGIQRLTADDLLRVQRPFNSADPHWADDLSADQMAEHLRELDEAAGIRPPLVAAAEWQIIETFRSMHAEMEFENLSGTDEAVKFVRDAKLPINFHNLQFAAQQLLAARTIHAADGSAKVKYGGTTLENRGGNRNAQSVLPSRPTEIVQNRVQKFTPDQIRNMTASEYQEHLSDPAFVEAVDNLRRG